MFSGIFDAIETWLKGLLISTINSNLTTMFADINAKTGDIAAQVGQTPQEWNSGIFSMIQSLSETVKVLNSFIGVAWATESVAAGWESFSVLELSPPQAVKRAAARERVKISRFIV